MQRKIEKTYFLDRLFLFSIYAFIATLLCYIYVDVPLAEHLRNISAFYTSIAEKLTRLIDPKYQYTLWAPLFFVTRYVFKRKKLAYLFLLLAIALPTANALIGALKLLFTRARPHLLLEEQIYGFFFFINKDIYLSFPSGHACAAGGLYGSLSCYFPRYPFFFLSIFLFMAFTRVILEMHFLSDVLAGFFIGYCVSHYVYFKMEKEKRW